MQVILVARHLNHLELKIELKIKLKTESNSKVEKKSTHCSKSSVFVQKFNFWFPEKIVDFFLWKTRENVVVLDFLAVDKFDFTRKIVKKIWVKNFWKCWGFVKIEFLDKKIWLLE